MGRAGCGLAVLAIGLLAPGCFVLASPAAASPGWLAPVGLSAANRKAGEAAVAMGEGGETVAVWQRQSDAGIGQVVQGSTRPPGGRFSPPFELSADASGPALAMTPSGEAVAVWSHFEVKDDGVYTIQASYRPPGGSFEEPVDVASVPNADLPRELHVAIDSRGDTAVVWTEQEAKNNWVAKASLRAAGGSFSVPATISPAPPTAESVASEPRVVIGAGGSAVAAWVQEEGAGPVVEAAWGAPAAGFAAPQSLSAPGRPAASPAIAIGSDGGATAVWSRSNGFTYSIEAASASPGGSFSTPREISDPGESAFEPELAAGPAGAVTAVWTRSDGSDFLVEAATAEPGGDFGAAIPVSEPGGDATRPQVAEDSAGATTIVWQRSEGSRETIQAAVGSAAGFGPPVEISGEGPEPAFPAVAMDGEGDATAVWRTAGATGLVRAAGYDGDAPQLRNLSIPSRAAVGVPVSFFVAPFDVWQVASTTFRFDDGSFATGASVTHTYRSPGVYEVSAEARDAAETAATASGSITVLAPNDFSIGRLVLDRRKGTGVLHVAVPWPGKLVLAGAGVANRTAHDRRAESVAKLPIVARASAHRALSRAGAVRVGLRIEFTPTGGEARVKRKSVTLIKKIHRGRAPAASATGAGHHG